MYYLGCWSDRHPKERGVMPDDKDFSKYTPGDWEKLKKEFKGEAAELELQQIIEKGKESSE